MDDCMRVLQSSSSPSASDGVMIRPGSTTANVRKNVIAPRGEFPKELSFYVLDLMSEDDPSVSLIHYLLGRGIMSLVCSYMVEYIRTRPAFWSRLLISPRIPISFLAVALERAGSESLLVHFRAVQGHPTPLTYGDTPCELSHFVIDAACLLRVAMPRCVVFSLHADTPYLLDDVLDEVERCHPTSLRIIVASFLMANYSELRPHSIDHYEFGSTPPLGVPFRPVTNLSWAFGDVANPTVTYSSSGVDSCSIVHPNGHSVAWTEVLAVLTMSMRVTTLVLDKLLFNYRPHSITCSPPFPALRILDLTFGGIDSMAYLVSRLNIPTLHTLRVHIADICDITCLTTCSTLLSSIYELVLIGSCPLGPDFYSMFSLLHRVAVIDLRLCSRIFFSALCYASRLIPPDAEPNWNAAPALRRLLVHEASLFDLRLLMEQRRAGGYPRLDYVMVSNPNGGWNAEIDTWFQTRGIELAISEFS
ncbi:hypothetical protein C8R44DRAFT_755060 [Mycena epipterygia]|nr:hypothetical protein C8R44DRAFT_755060 [Mycena epipterygia]